MKKTKINIGAILLIVYAVMAVVIQACAQNSASYYFSYGGPYSLYSTVASINTIFNNTTLYFTILITFCTVLLFEKRWANIVIGAAMTAFAALGSTTFMVQAGTSIGMGGFEWSKIILPAVYFIFVTLLDASGWVCYMLAGIFSAKTTEKKSVAAMVLKIVSAPLVVISGINKMIFLTIVLLTSINPNLSNFFILLWESVILPYGIVVVLSFVSLLVLAAGIVLSVRCQPENMPEIKANAEAE